LKKNSKEKEIKSIKKVKIFLEVLKATSYEGARFTVKKNNRNNLICIDKILKIEVKNIFTKRIFCF